MRARSLVAVPALTLLGLPAQAQMRHPPGMTHNQVIEAASAAAPDSISRNATIAWIDSAGTATVMRPGSNGFTCVIVVPDPFGGPLCGDQNAASWMMAFLTHQPQPPTMSGPGIAYMGRGGSHWEDAAGNVVLEHDQSPHASGTHRVVEQPHWMLIWPFDPAATGLPTRENGAGAYIMFAGTPWAHLMVYQDPNRMRVPLRR